MANASAKKTAAQNETAIKILKIGMLVSNISYFILRLILPYRTFPPTWRQLTPYIMTAIPEFVLFQHLTSTGSPKREPTTGALLAPGEDLSQRGVTEWCFDIIYITWVCQIGSALIGEFVWWLYLSIPIYAAYKAWRTLVVPMLGSHSIPSPVPESPGGATATGTNTTTPTDGLSKKQSKQQQKKAERRDTEHAPYVKDRRRR